MHQADCDSAFSHRGCHPSDRPLAYVSSGENSRHTGFQYIWVAFKGPVLRPLAIPGKVLPGEDKPGFVAFYHTRYHLSMRRCADKNEYGGGLHDPHVAGFVILNSDTLKPKSTAHLDHFCIQLNLDILCSPDLVNQVLRH